MSSWLSTVHITVSWECECGEMMLGPCEAQPCGKCGRIWRVSTNTRIRYDAPPKPKEPAQSGPALWDTTP